MERALRTSCDVVVETHAARGLARLEAGESFDVVLCDLMMPEMTGMDLFHRVVARAPAYASRIVFMTGGAFTRSAVEFLQGLPNPCLEKPFELQALRSTVTAVAAKSREPSPSGRRAPRAPFAPGHAV